MSDSAHPTLATFLVQRDQDASGISGTGVVAEGVQFSDGWVVTHWLDQAPMWEPKTDVWHHKGTGPVTKIHGHGGATRIVWTRDKERQGQEFLADVAEAFDIPGWVVGTEAERVGVHRQMTRALLNAWHVRGALVAHPEDHCASFADAVMPIVGQILEQRTRAQATVARARALADRWQTAHGSSMFLVRAAAAELRDVLDDSGAAPGEVVHSGVNGQVSGLSGVDYVAAAECSAQHHGFPGDHRECIRAAQHRGDHIDEHGFHWSDTVAVYPVSAGEPREGGTGEQGLEHGRAGTSSCGHPDHACVGCGDCVYEHPYGVSCMAPETSAQRNRSFSVGSGAVKWYGLPEDAAEERLEEVTDAVRRLLGIDAAAGPADVVGWLLTACRELEKSEGARSDLRRQRNDLAQALRESLAAFHAVRGIPSGEVIAYEASHVIHPSNFARWRAVLAKAPANCQKPGGCFDCPHETGA